VLAAPTVLSAQAPGPSFQVVSIRKSETVCPPGARCIILPGRPNPDAPSMSVQPGGRFEARIHTIEDLARVAYGFEDVDPRGTVRKPWFFLAGQDKYDITAVADREWSTPPAGDVVPSELRPMLRALLQERFQLEARIDVRKVDVYALRRARPGSQPGPGLRESRDECRGPFTPPPSGGDAIPQCPFRLETNVVQAGAVTMADLARIIPRITGSQIDRVIVDQTGLDGTYDVELTIGLGSVRPSIARDPSDLDRLSIGAQPTALLADRRPIAIREALEQQLGLKLEKATLPIPVLTIEGAKRPVED
jgi:uncharacterized protein (TIGR03435 family)